MPPLAITPELLAELKEAYQKVLNEKKGSFTFHGHELDLPYARYLIQYAEQTLRPKNGKDNSKGPH